MKNILIITFCAMFILVSMRQDDEFIDDLPELTTIAADGAEYMYILDGTTDKHVQTATILNAAQDSVEVLESAVNDSLAIHWAAIGGGAGWSKTGNYMYLTNINDSTGFGTNTPQDKVHIVGTLRITDDVKIYDTAKFGSYQDAWIAAPGSGNLTLHDEFAGTYTLSELLALTSNAGSLLTYQGGYLHLGGSADRNTTLNTSGYTFTITGMGGNSLLDMSSGYVELQSNEAILTGLNKAYMQTSQAEVLIDVDGSIYLNSDNGNTYVEDSLYVSPGNGVYYLITRDATGFRFDNPVSFRIDSAEDGNHLHGLISMQFTPSSGAPSSPLFEGKIYYDEDDSCFKYYTGYSWYDVGTGGGTGDVSVSGTPVNNQIAIWTDASTIEGDADLTFDGDTLTINKQMKYKTALANGGDTCWMALLPSGTGYGWITDTSEIAFSSWASYRDSIESFDVFFATRDNSTGEWNWQRYFGDSYHMLNPKTFPQQLQIALEKNFVYDFEVRQRLDSLELKMEKPQEITIRHETTDIPDLYKNIIFFLIIGFISLLGWNVYQHNKINKLHEKLSKHMHDITVHKR